MKNHIQAGAWRLATTLAAASLGLAACGGSSSDDPSPPVVQPSQQSGYITLPDGNKMRYSLLLPEGQGPFPLLVEYDGYSSGSYPNVATPWTQEGYAVMGLNLPGTGCSTGEDQVFDASVGAAGAFAIEWAGKQSWSNGRIGMIGYSYSGYNQLWVAAHRPKGLVAITPSKTVTDPYRDVAYPGGIANIGFPSQWWSGFPTIWERARDLAAKFGEDTGCAKTVAENIEKIKRPDLSLLEWTKHPYADGLYIKRSAMYETGKINIPALGTQSWQDEQIGPRSGYYEDTMAPDRMWLVSSNGDHHTNVTSGEIDQTLKRFLAHFVKQEDNGFEKEPHVRLLQEMQIQDEKAYNGGAKLEPTAMAEFDRLPVPVKPLRLWMQPGEVLGDTAPAAAGGSSSYRYPVKSPQVNNPAAEGWQSVASSEKDGQLVFTTPVLPEALSFYGEGSADLWLSSTEADTDLQVTLSEVRPDGQEMFVQRGWLRASKRALDASRSTELRPYGSFLQKDESPLVPGGQPVLARVEINKFAHVFRAGSSIRVTIDTPSQTGFWIFGNDKRPSTNTLWHEPGHASSIVLGYIPYKHAQALPSCDKTIRQPCRKNEHAVPAGVGPRAPV
ncbi:CocE/NonD family hydrolase [Comamonas composti]|uniref:CocE/NonD family hydrolase n=1 Tax=Comamonas composti TaxID=408558 RepID=UPI00040DDE82|nr:CocE/NonD family hydrolase [Comamonas composti]